VALYNKPSRKYLGSLHLFWTRFDKRARNVVGEIARFEGRRFNLHVRHKLLLLSHATYPFQVDPLGRGPLAIWRPSTRKDLVADERTRGAYVYLVEESA